MATRTVAAGGGNWDAVGTWEEGAVPVAGDDVVCDSGSGNLTVNVAAGGTGLKSLNCTGYTGVLAWGSNTITVGDGTGGGVTFDATMAAMTGTTSGGLICKTSMTITSGGKVLPGRLDLQGTSQTYTLGDDWSLTGKLKTSGNTQLTINGYSITAANGIDPGITTLGTTNIVVTGGSWLTGAGLRNNLDINGNFTIAISVTYSVGTLRRLSGTVTTTGSTLVLAGGCTLDTAGITWNNVTVSTNGQITVNSSFNGATLTFGDNSTEFIGTAGISFATLAGAAPTGAKTHKFLQGRTYAITSAITLTGSSSFKRTLQSSDANDVAFTFSGGASPHLTNINATHLDSSGGLEIFTDGTVNSCVNWTQETFGGRSDTMRNVHCQAVHRASIW